MARTTTYTEYLSQQTFEAEITQSKLDKERYNVSVNGTKLGWLCKDRGGWTIHLLPRADALSAPCQGSSSTLRDGAWELMQRSSFLWAAHEGTAQPLGNYYLG